MKQKNSLTEGKILGSLMRFAVPVFFTLFLQALYGGVDLLVVGRFGETADVSGVATGSGLTSMLTNFITGLSMGITVLVGERIGEKRPKGAGDAIGSGICLFAVIAAVLTAVTVFGAGRLAVLLHAPEEALSQTTAYIRICGAGSLFIVAYNVLGAVFRGIGDARTPLVTVLIACVVNIFGDLFLVAVCHMGAAGAAVATVAAQAISVIVSLLRISGRELPFALTRESIRFHGSVIRTELKLGAPVALQEFFVGTSFLLIQMIVNGFGVVPSAAVGVAEKVCTFIMLIPSAYMQSMSAFVAQNMGAGKPERAKRALFCSIGTAFAVGVCMLCLLFAKGDFLAGIFTKDAAVIADAHSYLKAYGVDCLVAPVMFCFVGYYNGCEKTLFVMLQGFAGALLVRIPIVWLVSRIPGATLFEIGLGTPASSVVQLTLCVLMFFRMEKQRKEKANSPGFCRKTG